MHIKKAFLAGFVHELCSAGIPAEQALAFAKYASDSPEASQLFKDTGPETLPLTSLDEVALEASSDPAKQAVLQQLVEQQKMAEYREHLAKLHTEAS
jgi:hypothetical protein